MGAEVRRVQETFDVAVVGGGPAGMMAAVTAAEKGAAVILIEQNDRLGRKLRITGKGRCNVTNDCPPDEMLRYVTRNRKFLYSALFRFPPEKTMAYFEALGVPLKTERGRRVFPVSDKAADIAEAMVRDVRGSGVRVLHARVKTILRDGGAVSGVLTESGEHIAARAVIVATGGLSYPATGSRGDGYRMARDCGVAVTPLSPSLVPICTAENVSEMMGLSLRNVTLTVRDANGKEVYSELGEMMFTHFGVTGPLALSASAHMQENPVPSYRLFIDMKPALDEKTLDERLCRDLKENATRDFCNSLGGLLPASMIPYVVRESGIDPRLKCAGIRREDRQRLCRLLKAIPLTPTGFRPIDEAIVTAGGIEVTALDPKTMMVKTAPGLFFAGEVIDLDAKTGGYNLQIAFATGRAAGEGAAAFAAEEQKKGEKKMNGNIRIAIDGPSGSGKSSLAKKVARELGLVYVDTGAMYRAVGLYVRRHDVSPEDTAGVEALLPDITVGLEMGENGQIVLLSGEDVTSLIRTEEISMYASLVSKIPAVRAFLTSQQQAMAAAGRIVMDGRDIGTVVIPDAEVKIFLKTSPEERARRRYEELLGRGEDAVYEDVLRDIMKRDENDASRDVAPLRQAEDAVVIDNSGYEPEDTLREALEIIGKKRELF